MKTTKPRVNFDGREYVVRSAKITVPDLSSMCRFDALMWLNRNTYARGYSRGVNPLAGIGGAVKVIA